MKKYGDNPTMSETDRNEYNRLRDKIAFKNGREISYKYMKQRNQGNVSKQREKLISPLETYDGLKTDSDFFKNQFKTTDTVDLGSESYKTFEKPIRNKSLLPKKS